MCQKWQWQLGEAQIQNRCRANMKPSARIRWLLGRPPSGVGGRLWPPPRHLASLSSLLSYPRRHVWLRPFSRRSVKVTISSSCAPLSHSTQRSEGARTCHAYGGRWLNECPPAMSDSVCREWVSFFDWHLLTEMCSLRCVLAEGENLQESMYQAHFHILPLTWLSTSCFFLFFKLRRSVCMWGRFFTTFIWNKNKIFFSLGYFYVATFVFQVG